MVSAASSPGAASTSADAAIAIAATVRPIRAAGDDCDRLRTPETITLRVTTNPNLRSENINVGVSALQGSEVPLLTMIVAGSGGACQQVKFPHAE